MTTPVSDSSTQKAIKIEMWIGSKSVKYSLPSKDWINTSPLNSERILQAHDMAFSGFTKEAKKVTVWIKKKFIKAANPEYSTQRINKVLNLLEKNENKDKRLVEKDKILDLSEESVQVIKRIKKYLKSGDYDKIKEEIIEIDKKIELLKNDIWNVKWIQIIEEDIERLKSMLS